MSDGQKGDKKEEAKSNPVQQQPPEVPKTAAPIPQGQKPAPQKLPEPAKPAAGQKPAEQTPKPAGQTPLEPAKPVGQKPPEPTKPPGQQPPELPKPAGQKAPELPKPSAQKPPEPAKPAGQKPPEPAKPAGQKPQEPAKPVGQNPPEPAKPAGQSPPEPAKPAGQKPPEPTKPPGQQPPELPKPSAQKPPEPAKPASQKPPEPAKPNGQKPSEPTKPCITAKPSEAGAPVQKPGTTAKPTEKLPEAAKSPAPKTPSAVSAKSDKSEKSAKTPTAAVKTPGSNPNGIPPPPPRHPAVVKLRKDLKQMLKDHHKSGSNCVNYTKEQLMLVLDNVRPIFAEEKMLIRVQAPITLVGDIHGQYVDLKGIFRVNGTPPQTRYIFLGDYVDRGPHQLETIVLLFAYKILYPKLFVMLRGNHECSNVNAIYGFMDEMTRRGFWDLYPEFNRVFNFMPLAAIIQSKILCMHGGISEHIQTLDDIKNIKRPLPMLPPKKAIPKQAIDLLWSDPQPERETMGYSKSLRGCGNYFGIDVLEEFCQRLKLDLVVRGHQVIEAGFERIYGPNNNIRLVTLFSAPNYCNEMDNAAAVMAVDAKLNIRFSLLVPTDDREYHVIREAARKVTPKIDVMPDEGLVSAVPQ